MKQKQEHSDLLMLPKDIQRLLTIYLSLIDLAQLARVSQKIFISKFARDCLIDMGATVPHYRIIPAKGYFYTVGSAIVTTQQSTIFDYNDYPYVKDKEFIPDTKIHNAVPKHGDIKVFRIEKDAAAYARSLMKPYDPMQRKKEYPIFRVQLTESTYSRVHKIDQTDSEIPIEYIELKAELLRFISGHLGHRPEVLIDATKECQRTERSLTDTSCVIL